MTNETFKNIDCGRRTTTCLCGNSDFGGRVHKIFAGLPPAKGRRIEEAMAITDINSEDRLVQRTFAEHLEKVLEFFI